MPVVPVDIPRLRARFETLRTDKSGVEAVWDEIERYIMPATGKTNESRPNLKTDVEAWDLTAPLACEHLASSLHGNVTSPVAQWVDFEWEDGELERDQDAVKYREELARLVWSALQSSDFNMEIASAYHEYAGLGNMALLVEAANPSIYEGLDFTAIPVREAFYEEDSRGGVKTFFRLLKWTAVQVLDKFGEKGTPEWIRLRAAAPDGGTTRLELVFCIYRREEVPLKQEGPLVPEARPWGAVYFPLEKPEKLGEVEEGYYEMPAVIARWGRVPGLAWGFGRGNIALRHAKYLCKFKESARAAAAKAANPPAVGTERGVLSPPDLEEGGYTVVADPDDLKFIHSGAKFDVAAEVLRDERTEIRRAFHEDDLQLKESPAMTAREVIERRDLMDRVLSSPVGRLQNDALVPVVMIALGHLSRAKKLPPAPDLVRQKKAELKVTFRGPLARAQVMDKVVAIERSAAFIASLTEMGFTQAKHYFDEGRAIREHAKMVGSPAFTIRSEAEVKKRVEAEAAAMARATNAEASKTEAEAMRAAAAAGAMQAPVSGGSALSIAPQPALVPSGGGIA
jgi:hypothetical protein